jgi:hypothetical protein
MRFSFKSLPRIHEEDELFVQNLPHSNWLVVEYMLHPTRFCVVLETRSTMKRV